MIPYLKVTIHDMDLVGVGDGGPGQEEGVPGLPPGGDDSGVGGVQHRIRDQLVQSPQGQQSPLEVGELLRDV
mgnify:CR=1 FL=1